jgi:hypothetical protein
MKHPLRQSFVQYGSIFLALTVVFTLLDCLLGDGGFVDSSLQGLHAYFNPTFATLCFSSTLAFAGTALYALTKPRQWRLAFPWVAAGAMAFYVMLTVLTSVNSLNNLPSDGHKSSLGKAYYTLHSTIPYNSPFAPASTENDYTLQTTAPIFFATISPMLIVLVAGYGIASILFKRQASAKLRS